MNVLQTYLHDLRLVHATGAGVAETSYYPAVKALLDTVGKTLKPPVRCLIHLQNRGAGLPDGGFFTPDQYQAVGDGPLLPGLLPSRGVLEVKGAAANLENLLQSDQVARYWGKYRQVLVTNLREFALVSSDADGRQVIGERFSLAATEAALWTLAARPESVPDAYDERFTEFLKRALLHAAPLATPEDVAWFLASYARDARSRIEIAEMPALAAVRTALEEALGLQFTGVKGDHFFRSTLVQTLFYGIFSAWVLWCKRHPHTSGARFSWKEAAWELHVPMIKSLFEQIATPIHLGQLGLVEVLEWTGAALGRVDRASFFARFDQGQAVQYFYEPFLQAFDPELRRDLGVWYTPPEIVQYMVARVDTVLRDELGLPDGLADPRVYVLDPCCGTGAYLVEVLHTIQRRLDAQGGDALGASDLKQAAMSRVFGFEILPAPFVVAHLQLGLLLQNAGVPLSDAKSERVGVYLTNALTGWEPPKEPKGHLLFPELEQERDAADQVKQQKPILVILGNPPYNSFAGMAVSEERALSTAYRTTKNAPAPQGQGLNDLYIRFFRMAERRIVEATGKGIVCFISNYSWLDGLSFTGMRERYAEVFDQIWIDNLHGDRIISEYSPDGKTSETVFAMAGTSAGIRIGTAITTMVAKPNRPSETAHILYRDHDEARAADRRQGLLDSLNEPDFQSHYKSLVPVIGIGLPFKPRLLNDAYLTWLLLPDLFPTSFPGIKTSRDDVVVDIDRDRLEQRMRQYFDPHISNEAMKKIAPSAMKIGGRFDPVEVREHLLKRGLLEQNFVRYNYRPFDVRWLYWEPETKLLDEKRTDFIPHIFKSNFSLVSQQKPRREWSLPQAIQSLGCLDLMDRGASCIPLWLRNAPSKDLFSDHADHAHQHLNLSEDARAYLAGLGIPEPDADTATADLLFMHTLAILHAPTYRDENAGALRQDWPRIPLPATREHLEASAALGRSVVALLDTETPVPGVTTGTLRDELKTLGPITKVGGGALAPDSGDLRITAGWGHAGKEGVTMPGQGRTTARDFTAIEADALGPDAIAILGPSTRDVFLNDVAYWRNVPERVWTYTIGGYQVIKKWLSYREAKLLGRDLTVAEVREVTAMIRRIAELLLGEAARDANYQQAKTEGSST